MMEEKDFSANKVANKPDMFLGASPYLFENAKRLRSQETEAEKFLWSKLSNKQLGVKFRRQHPIYSYVADFYCHAYKLVIEVDGPIHNSAENIAYDKIRTQAFQEFIIEVIRFTNDEVLKNMDIVLQKIRDYLSTKLNQYHT